MCDDIFAYKMQYIGEGSFLDTVQITPFNEKYYSQYECIYAEKVCQELSEAGIRCELDERAEKIGFKIREAQLDKVPYMVIVGQKEMDANEISVRGRDNGDMGNIGVAQLLERLKGFF